MVYIQLEHRALLALCYLSAETDLVVLTFQLLLDCETVTFFFLVFLFLFFRLFFLSYFIVSFVFFRRIFWFSPQSHSLSPLPPHLLQTRENDHFVPLQTICSNIPRSWLKEKVRAALWSERLCTDWRFSIMESLAVILNCRWQVKRLKVSFNSVWKENIVFSAKKKKQ